MSLLDFVTGGKSEEANADLEKALAAIQGVQTPKAQQMEYQLQKLVQAGVLTPQQAKTYLQNPNAMLGQNISQTGTQTQETAISDLLDAAHAGGLNPQEQAQMAEITREMGTQEKGANDAVLQNAAARGALTGGETIAAQLANNQNATANANQNATATAGQAYQNMLNELTSAGAMGSGLQGQQNNQSNAVASATNAINQFNAAQQQQQENYNVGNNNEAQAYNLENLQKTENQNVGNENEYARYKAQLPQEVFQDEMSKAGAEAGVNTNQANQATQQGGQEAALIGGLVGTGGQIATAGMAPTPQFNFNTVKPGPGQMAAMSDGGEIRDYLDGGMVDGRANVPGDSRENDTVPAVLSPGEIVLPRTVAQNPQPDKVMEFLNRIRQKNKPTPIHPEDTAHVLKALSLVRDQHAA